MNWHEWAFLIGLALGPGWYALERWIERTYPEDD